MDEVKDLQPEAGSTLQPTASAPMPSSESKPTPSLPQEQAVESPTEAGPTPPPTEPDAVSEPTPLSVPEPKPAPEVATSILSPENLPPSAPPSVAGVEKETAAEPKLETTSATGKKILLVDDDEVFSELYASVFNSAGYNCIIAGHGLEALDAAREEQPNIILLDIMMPDINGFEVLKRLKKDPTTSQIPVWMLSNLAEQIDRETAANLGAADYLVKSANTPKQVCEKIAAFFGDAVSGL